MRLRVTESAFAAALLVCLLCVVAAAQDGLMACQCKCGGNVQCPTTTTGWCECINNQCSGGCLPPATNSRALASTVLTKVTGEGVTPEGLRQDPQRFAEVLSRLLESQSGDGAYRIEYAGREVGFVFPAEAAASLRRVLIELQSGVAGAPSPSPSPDGPHGTAERFSLTEMVTNLGRVEKVILGILILMSMYSIAIMVERALTYSAAKKQSREFAPRVAQALKNDRIDEAINIAEKHRRSHLAMVVNAGLREYRAHESSDIPGEEIDASKRALQRAIAIKSAELKRGLSGVATVGSTAPFIGLFGTVFGIISAFVGMRADPDGGFSAVAGGIAESLLTTALGLAVAVPAVWLFNYFTRKVDGFTTEMDNSATELVDYLLKNRTRLLDRSH